MNKKPTCVSCGSDDYLGKNSKGVIHCVNCCQEDNDKTGLACEPLTPKTKEADG